MERFSNILATYEDNVLSFEQFKGILQYTYGDMELATAVATQIVSSQLKATEEEFRVSTPVIFNGVNYSFADAKVMLEAMIEGSDLQDKDEVKESFKA